jgi:hypothetical protein
MSTEYSALIFGNEHESLIGIISFAFSALSLSTVTTTPFSGYSFHDWLVLIYTKISSLPV